LIFRRELKLAAASGYGGLDLHPLSSYEAAYLNAKSNRVW
jgi:hypothetical protein